MKIEEYLQQLHESDTQKKQCLNEEEVKPFLDCVIKLLFLDYYKIDFCDTEALFLLERLHSILFELLYKAGERDAKGRTEEFIDAIPNLRELLLTSAKAIFDGDPACDNIQEVILAYPGFQAIINHRIAHKFYEFGDHFLARLISERAHKLYGIDINPGAKIGRSFFIDHGTGIVIGETAVIGDRVKLYQGVTIGALSLKEGHNLQGIKRHPTIEDDVTIYSNASIFGGDTVIGEGSTIGANTYLTSSVNKRSRVYLNDQGMTITRAK